MKPLAVAGVLLDIEGTLAPVSFVYDVLFPYARRELPRFLRENWDAAAVRGACERVAADAGFASLADWAAATSTTPRELVERELLAQMDADRKATGLKQIQGLIWEAGYARGELVSKLFDDVPPALRHWKNAALDLRIFSSGSAAAQRVFFAHTEHGDLTPLFSGHYDTTLGPKNQPASYAAIAAAMDLAAGAVLFLSDVPAELDAAAAAGMQVVQAVRPGNPAAQDPKRTAVTTLAALELSPECS